MTVPEKIDLVEIRQAVADYLASEGCSCCGDEERHPENRRRLAKLLHVPGKGPFYNFEPFETHTE